MKVQSSSIAKGMAIGLAVGGATAMIGSAMMNKPTRKKAKKNAARAMKTVGNIVDNMSSMKF